jgi:hypothetical protein
MDASTNFMQIRFAIALLACLTCRASGAEVKLPPKVLAAPLFGRHEYINFDINVSGAKGSEKHAAGGNGGIVEIHLADPTAVLDEKAFVNAPVLKGAVIALDERNSPFKCRGAVGGTVFTVAGTVTIECKGLFDAEIKGDLSRGAAHVTVIINGESDASHHQLRASISPGADRLPLGSFHPNPVYAETAQDGGTVQRDGGTLVVKTSAVGEFSPGMSSSYIYANGGAAWGGTSTTPVKSSCGGRGGAIWIAGPCVELYHGNVNGGHGAPGAADPQSGAQGGDAGTISIHAQAFSCGVLYAMGGAGGFGNDKSHAGNGGRGGHICIMAESLGDDGVCCQVSGGDGGNTIGPPWHEAGTGGDGGTIYLEASQWWDSERKSICLIADGGAAGDGNQSSYAKAPMAASVWSYPGTKGGKGGTIEVIHNEQPLHEYPKKGIYDGRDHPEDKRQEVTFKSAPAASKPPYGPHSGREVAITALGGSGGLGREGLNSEHAPGIPGSRGGSGGPGGVVSLPEEWKLPLSAFFLLGGGAGGGGGNGANGRRGDKNSPDGGDGTPGGEGGAGGQPGRVNGEDFGPGGNGGNGGRGGVGGRGFTSKYSGGRGGDGGKGGNAGNQAAIPGKGGEGGGSESSSGTDLRGRDGQTGGIGGPTPEAQEVWAEVMPFNTAAAIALDYNRDGEISFGPDDRPTKDKPFTFWVNDDRDVRVSNSVSPGMGMSITSVIDEDLHEGLPSQIDAGDSRIASPRDLEDFTRLWVRAGAVQANDGSLIEHELTLEALEGDPAINVFLAESAEGSLDYLVHEESALRQIDENNYGVRLSRISNHEKSISLPAGLDYGPDRWCLIFEGASPGLGALRVETVKDGKSVAKSDPIYLRLRKSHEMIDVWSVGDVAAPGVDPTIYPRPRPIQPRIEPNPGQSGDALSYFMFVHGWNMTEFDKRVFASTAFKRLWQQGFKGRFGAFHWPTFHMDESPPLEPVFDAWNYDTSEHNAWLSGKHLAEVLKQLGLEKNQGGYSSVHLYAHSMGNVVAGEALRELGPESTDVSSYIAAQAAVSADAWDRTAPRRSDLYKWQLSKSVPPNVFGYYWEQNAMAPPSNSESPPSRWQKERRFSYFHPSYMPRIGYSNHVNPKDYALRKWELNQTLRPSNGYDYDYERDIGFERIRTSMFDLIFDRDLLYFPNDRHEIFAFAAESHSYALGQELAVRAGFGTVDLSIGPFFFGADRSSHSAQFNDTIQKRWKYWRQVMKDMGLTPIEP